MRSQRFFLSWSLLVLLAIPTAAMAQHKQRPDDIARDYNTRAQTVTEEIEALRRQLDKGDLSMSEASRIIEQQSELRRKADALWSSTQSSIDASFRQTRDEITQYNKDNRQLGFESAVIGSKVDLLNNIAKNTTKDAFEKNKAQMGADWEKNYGSRLKPFGEDFARDKEQIFKNVKEKYGIDLIKEGYSQIGTSNPYTGEVYYKYYGPDGNILWIQWKDDAAGWKKYREDAEAYRRRQRDLKDRLDKEAAGLKDVQSQVDNSRRNLGGALDAQLADARRKQGQAQESNLVGSTWVGTARNTSNGQSVAWQVSFTGEGTARVQGNRGAPNASWNITGKTVRIRAEDANRDLVLTISGNVMTGNFLSNDGRTNIAIEVRRQ